jgi:hypothetical protein
MSDVPVFDISARDLSRQVGKHFGWNRYDLFYTANVQGSVIECWAGDWIHPALERQVNDVREGRLTSNIELLLRLMVKDGALEKGLYRIAV